MSLRDRMTRDSELFVTIVKKLNAAEAELASRGIVLTALSVAAGEGTNHFPLDKRIDGRNHLTWKELTDWMKAQIAVLVMAEYECLTFSANLHPEFEAKVVAAGSDVRAVVRDRLRRELAIAHPARRIEHFFVLEGHEKSRGPATRLHLQGAAYAASDDERRAIETASRRATGNDLRSSPPYARASHQKWLETRGSRFVDYLFKNADRSDPRMTDRRLAISNSLIGGAREFYEMMIGKPL